MTSSVIFYSHANRVCHYWLSNRWTHCGSMKFDIQKEQHQIIKKRKTKTNYKTVSKKKKKNKNLVQSIKRNEIDKKCCATAINSNT